MSDWLDEASSTPPGRGTTTEPPDRWRQPKKGPAVPPTVLLGAEFVLLAIGVAAVVILPRDLVFYGYVACGLVLPFVWAFLYMQIKKQAIEQENSTLFYERINRVVLWAGVALSAACALLAARQWSK